MDAWSQRRGLQAMNLRSVFTAEQQRILERYYENGMTNQSKACFQLILQCAQEAKLDFSVVRTWVGNKRRKLASKVEQNGGVSHSLSSHGLAGGLLPNHTLATAQTIQNRVHLLPPSSSFPSFSSTSSSPSSSSPLSSGSSSGNHNNDVILTGIYSLNSALQSRSSSASSPLLSKLVPHSNPQPQLPAPQKTRASVLGQSCGTSLEQTPRIQQVFTLSERVEEDRQSQGSTWKGRQGHGATPHPLDTSHNFSIAMETGNEEDEWQREEELASMAARTHINREQTSASPTGAEVSMVKGSQTPTVAISRPTMLHSNTTLQGSYSVTAQTSLTGESSSQVGDTSVGASASPWLISNSRKRTLQDRTQFSNGDLIQLKRYWDRGMTSLGSVCREKITAAANQLSVDTEIVKTWISNRRRKYRLMGIEIPPPKGGPAVLTTSAPGDELCLSIHAMLCLVDGTSDSQHRDGEEGIDVPSAATLANNVKIEVIDDDEEEDNDNYNGELVASDLEQMQSLLEFKHEEVQFLENELENQKQKYQELASFTQSLLSAVRRNDLERQQELMASLPQPSDQDWDVTVERGADPAAAAGASSDLDDSPTANTSNVEPPSLYEVQLVTQPSASEEQPQEAISEQK
uniref:Homeobox domain-containing protein n=1 Tax=Mola mola TaxID=94237 RepID=A0A3Q3WJH3_MOLML